MNGETCWIEYGSCWMMAGKSLSFTGEKWKSRESTN